MKAICGLGYLHLGFSAFVCKISTALQNGSSAGLDLKQVSSPTISLKKSEAPMASRVFLAGNTGLLVTQISLKSFCSRLKVSTSSLS